MSAAFIGLQRISLADAPGTGKTPPLPTCVGYGPLVADPARIFDLPKGFRYRVIAQAGERLDDGFLLPGDPDGMAAFPTGDGRVAVICNHELDVEQTDKSPFGSQLEYFQKANRSTMYDAGYGKTPQLGGTSTIIFDPKTWRKDTHYLSLAGTERNCAGGPTPWNTWISCEETNTRAGDRFEQDHGYNFEVPVSTTAQQFPAIPLKAMGRFRHEAIAVEPKSGIVYQTEDMGDGLIYRFIPTVPGQLEKGGRLQALAIAGQPSRDTRNWPSLSEPKMPTTQLFDVTWVDIDNVESPDDDLRFQGYEKGAARFARGEGMWYADGEVYFACTNGGRKKLGQIFRYLPSQFEGTARESEAPGQLELFIESSDQNLLKNCDNLTIAENGNLFICEDADDTCKIVGITPEGKLFEFARNAYTDSELAGACFSPDGQTMFVNIQKNGMTLAITGPWGDLQA
jgi:secreted PhoX family phosphatase